MKTLFIGAQKKSFHEPNPSVFSGLPEKIGLLYTIQYKPLFEKIKQELERQGKKIFVGKSSLDDGMIIGCNVQSALSMEDKVDCFLLVSSGRFHAMSVALNLEKSIPIYIIGDNKLDMISKEETDQMRKKRKAALSKFILAEKVGIIVSTKRGQNNLKKALEIRKKLKKESFIFMAETINAKELENFKIDAWLNTACPGLVYDCPDMINLYEYEKFHQSIEKLK